MEERASVVLTREPADNADLAHALEEKGVPVREVPCMRTEWVTPTELPETPDALAFTSRRGVAALARVDGHGRLIAGPGTRPSVRPAPIIGAVGQSTARELASMGFPADVVAVPPTGESLARMLITRLPPRSRVLIVRGNLRGGRLDEILGTSGHAVEELVVYRNLPTALPPLTPFPASAVFVTAPSSARRLLEALPWMRTLPFFVLGPTTEAALADLGVTSMRRADPDPDTWATSLVAMHRQAGQRRPRFRSPGLPPIPDPQQP